MFRQGDDRFEGRSASDAVSAAIVETGCTMINRNPGSGTRVLIDRLLGNVRPAGYNVQTKSHNAVATAVVQGRADWGVAIDTVASSYGLGFLPIQDEHYDFIIPKSRLNRVPVLEFRKLLGEPAVQASLAKMGFSIPQA